MGTLGTKDFPLEINDLVLPIQWARQWAPMGSSAAASFLHRDFVITSKLDLRLVPRPSRVSVRIPWSSRRFPATSSLSSRG